MANDDLKHGEIKALFLLTNVMSLCQRTAQGIIEALKEKYLSYFILPIGDTEDCLTPLKEVDLPSEGVP